MTGGGAVKMFKILHAIIILGKPNTNKISYHHNNPNPATVSIL